MTSPLVVNPYIFGAYEEAYMTSYIYPVEAVESMNLTASITKASLQINPRLLDGANLTGSVASADLVVVVKYGGFTARENIDLLGSVQVADLVTTVKYEGFTTRENIDLSGSVQVANLVVTTSYETVNQAPESINLSGSVVSATLT